MKTIVFYTGFYAGVFLIFSFLLGLFLLRVDEIDPEVTYMDSPLQMNPGIYLDFFFLIHMCVYFRWHNLLSLLLIRGDHYCLSDIFIHLYLVFFALKLLFYLIGMTMRPVADFESSLIRFEQGKPHSYKPFTDHMQTLLWGMYNYDPHSVAKDS